MVGGGSAGHVLPAVPVIEALERDGVEVSFVGTTIGLEARLIEPLGVAYHGIASGKLRRYWSWRNVTDVGRVLAGLFQSWRLLGRLRPDVVFSKGGFVSLPVVVAAWLRRIPVVAHESDRTLGLANRLAAPFVTVLCTQFDAVSAPRAREVRVTGTPVRRALLEGDARAGFAASGLAGTRSMLVVTGGSLGANRLNAVVWDALDVLLERWDVVHVCGPQVRDAPQAEGYRAFDYIDASWGDVLAAADAVVSRAGAGALNEWITLGKPNLLIPLTTAGSRGDQIDNADWAQTRGFSLVLPEAELTPDALVRAVDRLFTEADTWRSALAAYVGVDSVALLLESLHDAAFDKRESAQ